MNELHAALDEYLSVRRALGVKLRLVGRLLKTFADFAEREGAAVITADLALRWATQPAHVQPAQWANRLGMVRRFAQYRSAVDPRTEVPPPDLLPFRFRRPMPYLYSDEEVARLLEAARLLPPASGLRPHTYATLFGLYAVTGIRTNEPLHLDREDVDLTQGVLTVRGTKFGKSRFVPIHPSTQRALQDYAERRDALCPRPLAPSFFLTERGGPLTEWSVRWTFVKLSRQIGLRGPQDSLGPRLHDFRHRFAVKALLQWYRCEHDVEHHLPELATYLGHTHVADTYWYLTAVPELLNLVALRVEQAKGGCLS